MTNISKSNDNLKLSASREELEEILGCGRATAERVGEEANAKFKIGRRTLYNLEKIEEFINSITNQSDYKEE